MVTLVTRKDIPPWVKVPEDLKDPEVFQVQSLVLKYLFGDLAAKAQSFGSWSSAHSFPSPGQAHRNLECLTLSW